MLVWPRSAVLCSCKPIGARTVVKHQRLVYLLFLSALLLLSSCALQPSDSASGNAEQSGSDQSPASERETGVCQCSGDSPSDLFMLGLQALSQGDYVAAGERFQEHALSGGEQAPREAAAGQALIETLSEHSIEGGPSAVGEVSDRAVLIDLVLVLIAGLEQQIANLGAENATLVADLDKREEALKRLRELTLGQPEA